MYTRKLSYEHFTPTFWPHYNFCEFTALEHKFKTGFKRLFLRFLVHKKIWLRFGMMNSINNHKRLRIPHTQHEFLIIINCICQTNWVKNIYFIVVLEKYEDILNYLLNNKMNSSNFICDHKIISFLLSRCKCSTLC